MGYLKLSQRMSSSLSPFLSLQLGRCCIVRSLLSRISDSNARSSPLMLMMLVLIRLVHTSVSSVRPHFFVQLCEIENVVA